jgi:hypothetical protein
MQEWQATCLCKISGYILFFLRIFQSDSIMIKPWDDAVDIRGWEGCGCDCELAAKYKESYWYDIYPHPPHQCCETNVEAFFWENTGVLRNF